MSNRAIFITAQDMDMLRKLISDAKEHQSYGNGRRVQLSGLEAELDRSELVAAHQVPPDVITMHSTAHLVDLTTGEELIYTLVFPPEADIRQGKISVLAPVGTAMLGYRVGDVFEWPVPDGLRRLRVKAVLFQPEAAGADA